MMHSDTLYKLFDQIAKTGGTNAKKNQLRQIPEAKTVLYYTYNPFFTYGIRFINVAGRGTNSIGRNGFLLLDRLNSRAYSGNMAKHRITEYARALTPESADLFMRIIKRDMRFGLNTKSINTIWPGLIPTHDVMLAQKVNWKKVIFPCYSSIKLDGVRGIFRDGEFYTRSGHKLVGLDHIQDQLKGVVPLDGELMMPNHNFDKGSGRIRSDDPTPDAIFHVFDFPESNDRTFSSRLNYLQELSNVNVKVVPHVIVNSAEEAQAHYLKCRAEGYEGTVLKPMDYQYVNKRSPQWMKIKAVESEDLSCVGFFEGTGKYEGSLGGIFVNRRGILIRVGGGFSDIERDYIWKNQHKFKDSTAEILYHELTADGSFRHPRFLRWRMDK